MLFRSNAFASLVAVLAGCNDSQPEVSKPVATNDAKALAASYQSITGQELADHVKVLASDKFGGRAPSSEGEKLTLEYLTKEFKALGFEPGNGDSYLQEVPLVSIEASPDMTLSIGGKEYQYGTDMVMGTSQIVEEIGIKDSSLVFVGYGVNAPEYNWNDYDGIDVKGKTVVILVNDPGYATKNPAQFTGEAMTYYGRWTIIAPAAPWRLASSYL